MTPGENLRRLLRPRQIALVGGRELSRAVGNCERLGYRGEIWVVNPKHRKIAGRRPYPSVAHLPAAPDAAFVGVRRELTVEAVRELAHRGAGGCVCYAAGFAEVGGQGRALQKELVRAAGEMAVVGPNCYGVLNYLDGVALWPDLHGGEPVERGVAIVSQSGNVALNATMAERSLPISHVVSIGNQAVLGLGDYVDALIEDARVGAIGMYVEGIDDVSGFSRAAVRALERGIPLVALKSGASGLGTQITLSHTSSLSAPDELYAALFRRLGIVRVGSVPALLETLKLLATAGPLEGRRLGVLAGSGGDSALVADGASRAGLELPEFGGAQRAALRAQLADFVSVSNPLDYNTGVWGDRAELERCFGTVMQDDLDATLLTLDYPRSGTGDRGPWDAAVDALVAVRARTGKPAAVASTVPELLPREARERLLAGGVVPLQGIGEALDALSGAAWYGERRREILAGGPLEDLEPARPARAPETSCLVEEWEAKRRLGAFGLRVPEGRLSSAARAPEVAAELGFPVVIKPAGPPVVHKSDLGAVALGLGSAEAVFGAVERIAGSVGGSPGAGGRFLVERMVGGAVAELIVGLRRDERLGLALVVGSGGILANLVGDSATLLLPTTGGAVARALDSLRAASLIGGFRGGAEGDREAAVDAILAVARFAEEHRDRVLELEVNPLLVLPRGEGAVAADALIRLGVG